MKNSLCRIIGLLLTLGLACSPALAQSVNNIADEKESDTFGEVVLENSAEFDNPNEELGKIIAIERPACDTPAFVSKALEAIKDYTNKIPASSTIEKRNKALILSNIDGFSQVSAEGFKPSDDFNTANALITIKINKKIDGRDIILCRQDGSVPQRLYLIAYPYADNYKVHVINLDKYSDNYEDVTFIYP